MAPEKKPMIVYKRRRDRISTLPDAILFLILSFLPNKYLVRTSALSKRWSLLYTSIPFLYFDDSVITSAQKSNGPNFINFVNSVFKRYKEHGTDISKFNLKCFKKYDMEKHLCRWISDAIWLNVSEIVLNIRSPLTLSLDAFISETLVELKVEGFFTISLSDSLWLPSLKVLHLVNVLVYMKQSQNLCFSSCILLEDLALDCRFKCDSSNMIEISVSSLRRLKLRLLSIVPNLMIDAPAIEFLFYHCSVRQRILGNVWESLNRAEIGVREPWSDADEFRNFMEMVSNVHDLNLFDHSMEALLGFEFTSYPNLTRLELKSTQKNGWSVLPDLLERSPNLEYLTLNNVLLEKGVLTDSVVRARQYECLSMHLKEVELRDISGFDYEFEVVKVFLENAKVLKKLTISYCRLPESRHEDISGKLVALRRYKQDCLIVVRTSNSAELVLSSNTYAQPQSSSVSNVRRM